MRSDFDFVSIVMLEQAPPSEKVEVEVEVGL